jgi:hypothetical protein
VARIKPATLLGLYPRSWRARYGDEFVALLEKEGTGPRVVINVMAGALDAWTSPRAVAPWLRTAPAGTVGPQLLFLRPERGPRPPGEFLNQLYFGAAVVVCLLGLAVLLHAAWGETRMTYILTRFPVAIAFVMSCGASAFRDYSKRTQLAAAAWKGAVMIAMLWFLTWLWP